MKIILENNYKQLLAGIVKDTMPREKIILDREEIISLKEEGNSWKNIAKILGVSTDTLRSERKRLKVDENDTCRKFRCVTKIDERKELSVFKTFDDLKKKTVELNKKFVDSIGYDEVEFDIPDRCGIVFLVDMHVGNKHTDHDRILKTIDLIKKNNIYVINGGDNCDNFDKKMSGYYEQILKNWEQKEYVKRIIVELKGKILGVIQGCHCEWLFNREEFDLSQYLAKHSGGKPLGFGAIVELNIGEQHYTILARHKITGYTPNSTLTSLLKYLARSKIRDLDIILTGHYHTYRVDRFLYNFKPTIAMIYPAFKVTDRFIDRKVMDKSPTNVPMLIFGKKKREILLFDTIEDGLDYL